MELKNGYKVVYAIAADGDMKFYATKSDFTAKEDLNKSYVISDVKVITAAENGKFTISKKDGTTAELDLSAIFVETNEDAA